MTQNLSQLSGGRLLLVVAAEVELRALCAGLSDQEFLPMASWTARAVTDAIDVVLSGIGKANAAGATAIAANPLVHRAVVSVGIGGSLPGGPDLGSVMVAESCAWADEGVATPAGFLRCDEIGFPVGHEQQGRLSTDKALRTVLVRYLENCAVGTVATVSTCSGRDDLAKEIAHRTSAQVEAMEGAAVVHTATRLGIAAGEVRVVSNTTGDRSRQRWDIDKAKTCLTRVGRQIACAARDACTISPSK